MKNIGTSIALFGGLVFASGIIFLPFLDALNIDVIALFLMWMGTDIRTGKRKNIKWPAIWCGWYCVLSSIMIISVLLVPGQVKIGKYHITEGWPIVATIAVLIICLIWSAFNLRGLLRYRGETIEEPVN